MKDVNTTGKLGLSPARGSYSIFFNDPSKEISFVPHTGELFSKLDEHIEKRLSLSPVQGHYSLKLFSSHTVETICPHTGSYSKAVSYV